MVYQYAPSSAQAALSGGSSMYYGTQEVVDLRLGLRWMPMPQLAIKLEGERIGKDSKDQEAATIRVAFGF